MKNILTTLLALIVTLLVSPVFAEDIDQREHIEVVGDAEIKVVPNEFVLRTGVTSFHKSLEKASEENDAAVARVFKDVTALGVARKYVVTDQVSVGIVAEGYPQQPNYRRLGYNVSRQIMVILHKPELIERAMGALFAAGVDHLSLSTGHTDIQKLVEDAQIAAATNATQKGKRLSTALGRKLGRAVSISDAAPAHQTPTSFVYTASTPDLGDGLALGKIRVPATVRVKYLLE